MRKLTISVIATFILVISLVVSVNNTYALNLDLPDLPEIPGLPKKKEPPRLKPTNTPVPKPTKEEPTPAEPTSTPAPAAATSTPVPAEAEGVGGKAEEEKAEEVSQPAAPVAPTGVGEVKALAAASGEDNLELIVIAAGAVLALSGFKMLWPRETEV